MSRRRSAGSSPRELLRAAGLRATAPRIAVLQCLLDSKGPLTHAEVCDRIGGDTFDRATVYRNLTDLVDAGFLHRADLGDHVWRFGLLQRDAQAAAGHAASAHPHFVCSDCGTVECLPLSAVELQTTRTGPKSLRRPGELEIQIRGRCDACA